MNPATSPQDGGVVRPGLSVFGVASHFVHDVVESAQRQGFVPTCIDNLGSADRDLPNLEALSEASDTDRPFTLGLSSARHRGLALVASSKAGFRVPYSLVDPTAVVAGSATFGHSAFVNAGVVVGSHTRIGCASSINRSASIGHDNAIGFSASVGPGAVLAGQVTLGAFVSIGAGAVILPKIVVHDGATIGAGAVVTRDVGAFEVVVGNPARILKKSEVTPLLTCPFCDDA